MIYNKVDSKSYKDSFIQKFTNFAEKSPIVVSFYTSDDGVSVVHVASGTEYFYYWDFVIPVKTFIHDIKKDLVKNHYPRISRVIEAEVPLTPEEQAEMIAAGQNIDEIPSSVKKQIEETYFIDKFLIMKDEFIIVNEDTRRQYCYKMLSSGYTYLKNYRTGKYDSLLSAGDDFFKKSVLVKELNTLED